MALSSSAPLIYACFLNKVIKKRKQQQTNKYTWSIPNLLSCFVHFGVANAWQDDYLDVQFSPEYFVSNLSVILCHF